MGIVQNLRVSQALLLVSIPPLVIALIGFGLYFNDQIDKLHSARLSNDVVEFAAALDGLAHNHAVERGLSAGYLGSGGSKGKDKLTDQRSRADIAEDYLRGFSSYEFEEISDSQKKQILNPILEKLSEKNTLRKKVDDLSAGGASFAYYSDLNRMALNGIEQLVLLGNDREVKNRLNALIALLWMKERAGQIRGMLNGIFATQKTSAAKFHAIHGFAVDQERWMAIFEDFAPVGARQSLNELVKQSHWPEVERVTNAFLAIDDLSAAVSIRTSRPWFDLATARIGDIKKVSDQLAVEVNQIAQEGHDSLVQIMVTEVIVVGVVVILVVGLVVVIRHQVSATVRQVHQALQRVENDLDMTTRIEDVGRGEIGEVASAVNNHLEHINIMFARLRGISREVGESLAAIEGGMETVADNTRQQSERYEQIATSTSEMSSSIEEIAGNMERAHAKIQDSADKSETSKSILQAMDQSIENLRGGVAETKTNIERLVGDAEAITGILDSITGIAEQTNLLALNAAIEAARAGEQGRGFAVVADEVRSLAQKTQEATDNIRGMLDQLNNSSRDALGSMTSSETLTANTREAVQENNSHLQQIFESLNEALSMTTQVATATQEQTAVMSGIEENVLQISEYTESTKTEASRTVENTRNMATQFQRLDQDLQKFKV